MRPPHSTLLTAQDEADRQYWPSCYINSLTLILVMQASPGALATYSFAFLILIVYLVDAIAQWRYQDRSWKYFCGQIFVTLLFFVSEVILVIYHQKEATLHGLQGMCLLQSLIIEASHCLQSVF